MSTPSLEKHPGDARRFALACAIMLAVAAGIVAKPLLSPPMVHDSFWIDYVWARQFAAELAAGNIYPRWLPALFGGLGAPVFYFYPPVAFYLVALLDLAGFATYPSIILLFGLSFFASGVGAFLLFRETARWPLAGAVMFMVAPYHLLDFTLRGALAESVAIALLPFLLIGLKRISEGKGWHFASLGYALLILTHLPFALLASLFLIAPFAVMKRGRLVPAALATCLGIGLAAIYLVPAIMLGPFRDEAQLFNEARLLPGYWSLYAGQWDDPFFVGIHLVIASIAIPAALFAVRDRDPRLFYALAICALAAGLVPLLWSLPILSKVQFSFRGLPFAELALAAYVAHRGAAQGKRLYVLGLPLIAGWTALAMVVPVGQSLADLDRLMPDVPEYLPPGVLVQRPKLGEWPDLRLGRVPPPNRGADTIVEPIFYFPIWSCGGVDAATKLLVHRAECRPRRIDAPSEGWSRIVSIVGALVFAALWLGRRYADPELVRQAGLHADRVSNVELPTIAGLERLAPEKDGVRIEGAMREMKASIVDARDATRKYKSAPSFAPAGQSTQMIVGADAASDGDIVIRASQLYDRFGLRRVYYSAFSPIPSPSAVLPLKRPPLMREHRLYQSDWLMRFYGFKPAEVVSAAGDDGMLPLDIDPKLAWALKFRESFPVDVNRASKEQLLRVPGLGTKAVARILSSRRWRSVTLADVARLTVSVAKVRPFIIASDWRPTLLTDHADLRALVAPKEHQFDLFAA